MFESARVAIARLRARFPPRVAVTADRDVLGTTTRRIVSAMASARASMTRDAVDDYRSTRPTPFDTIARRPRARRVMIRDDDSPRHIRTRARETRDERARER